MIGHALLLYFPCNACRGAIHSNGSGTTASANYTMTMQEHQTSATLSYRWSLIVCLCVFVCQFLLLHHTRQCLEIRTGRQNLLLFLPKWFILLISLLHNALIIFDIKTEQSYSIAVKLSRWQIWLCTIVLLVSDYDDLASSLICSLKLVAVQTALCQL